jgi:hypothetical protein
MSFNRMQETAIKLVADLGIDGTGHDDLTEPTIHPRDAVRYVIKTIRELRYQIGLGGTPNLPKVVADAAEHLDGDPKVIAAALSAEAATFAKETEEALTLLGGHGVFTVDEGYLDRRQLPDGVVPKDRVL